MMKIRWLSNGLYSLKNCHKQFGQAFRPPPFWAMPKFTWFFLGGASLGAMTLLWVYCHHIGMLYMALAWQAWIYCNIWDSLGTHKY